MSSITYNLRLLLCLRPPLHPPLSAKYFSPLINGRKKQKCVARRAYNIHGRRWTLGIRLLDGFTPSCNNNSRRRRRWKFLNETEKRENEVIHNLFPSRGERKKKRTFWPSEYFGRKTFSLPLLNASYLRG